jgi:putative transposase
VVANEASNSAGLSATFVVPPSGPNQVWQLDFSEFETRHRGVWRIGGVADYWSQLELGWRVSTTQNHRDAIQQS